MKKFSIIRYALLLILILLTACIYESPCDGEKGNVKVKFEVTGYLSDALNSFDDITPRSITLFLYQGDNVEAISKKINSEKGEISVAKGKYDIMIYTSDFYVADANFYKSMENQELAEAHTRQKIGENGVITMSEPDPLFVAYVGDYIAGTQFDNIKIEFLPLVYTYRFCIYVNGLNYVKTSKALITGLYSSVYLKNGNHREDEVAQISVNLTKKEGNMLCGEFRSFGSHQQSNVNHTITVALINTIGETKTVKLDDLTQIIKALPTGGEIVIDQKIVIESSGEDGGFKPGVDDWENDKRPLPVKLLKVKTQKK